jgi:hypothetical protein
VDSKWHYRRCVPAGHKPDLGAINVEHYPARWIDGFRPGGQLSIERGQTSEVVGLRQQCRLEGL